MKPHFFFLLILILSSCSAPVIYYQYQDTVLSRVDENGEITLYYGDIKKSNAKLPFIKATYSGFNSGVDAYLIFKGDKTVDVVGVMGYFIASDTMDKRIHLQRYENAAFDSVKTVYKQRGTMVRVSNVLGIEKETNLKNRTKVKATYP